MPIPLHHPDRPTLNHRPTYLNGHTVIQPLGILPRSADTIEVSAFLPLLGEGPFVAVRFEREIPEKCLSDLFTNYRRDPEGTLETFFGTEAKRPALRARVAHAPEPKAKSTSVSEAFDLMGLLQ